MGPLLLLGRRDGNLAVPKDVEPVTQLECAVTTVALFSGLILNAFVISALTSAMNSLDSAQAIASEKLEAVRNYLTFKGVGPSCARVSSSSTSTCSPHRSLANRSAHSSKICHPTYRCSSQSQ